MGDDQLDVRADLAGARTLRLRGRRQVAIVAAAVLAVIGLAAGGVAALWSGGGHDHAPRLATRREQRGAITPTTIPEACRAPLTSDAPLRLWIGGDSLAGTLGPALGDQTASTGVVLPTFDSRPSSGLASPSFFDWPKHATEEMARVNPEVVVFIIGANDWTLPRPDPVDATGRPAWKELYGQLVEHMLSILESNGRAVYWVGSPVLEDKEEDAGVQQINQVAREVVARHHDATYVDAYKLFSDSDGSYTATLPGSDGKSVRVRTDDGVHFTPAGAELLGRQIFDALDGRCHLRRQAVPGHKQPVTESPGSSQLPESGATPTTRAPTRRMPPPTTPPTVPPTTAPATTTTTSKGIVPKVP